MTGKQLLLHTYVILFTVLHCSALTDAGKHNRIIILLNSKEAVHHQLRHA